MVLFVLAARKLSSGGSRPKYDFHRGRPIAGRPFSAGFAAAAELRADNPRASAWAARARPAPASRVQTRAISTRANRASSVAMVCATRRHSRAKRRYSDARLSPNGNSPRARTNLCQRAPRESVPYSQLCPTSPLVGAAVQRGPTACTVAAVSLHPLASLATSPHPSTTASQACSGRRCRLLWPL